MGGQHFVGGRIMQPTGTVGIPAAFTTAEGFLLAIATCALRAARARRGPLARGVRTEICAAVGRSAQRPRTSYRVTCLTVPRRGRRCCISEPEAVLYQCAVPWRCGLLSCCWTGLPIAPMPRSHNFANRSASMHVFLHPPWLRSRRGAACFQIDYDKLEEEWMEDEDADGGALSELSFATPA